MVKHATKPNPYVCESGEAKRKRKKREKKGGKKRGREKQQRMDGERYRVKTPLGLTSGSRGIVSKVKEWGGQKNGERSKKTSQNERSANCRIFLLRTGTQRRETSKGRKVKTITMGGKGKTEEGGAKTNGHRKDNRGVVTPPKNRPRKSLRMTVNHLKKKKRSSVR